MLIKSCRMSCITDDKGSSIKVHATFPTTNKQMGSISKGSCTMEERWRDCSWTVIWACTNNAFVIGTCNTNKSICGLGYTVTVYFESLGRVIVQPEWRVVRNVNGIFDIIWTLMRTTETIFWSQKCVKKKFKYWDLRQKNRNGVISIDIEADSIWSGASSCCIDKINQSTSLGRETDAFLPHFCKATVWEKSLKFKFRQISENLLTQSYSVSCHHNQQSPRDLHAGKPDHSDVSKQLTLNYLTLQWWFSLSNLWHELPDPRSCQCEFRLSCESV